MSRYTGPSCKRCRKAEAKLFLKGTKCYSKCVMDKIANTARKGAYGGQKGGKKRRGKASEYSIRLKEKQKARRMAGMNEGPFKNLFTKASKTRGNTGEMLLRFLEIRFDNIVRRLGFTVSLKAARQLILHCHVRLNGKVVNIPSCHLKPGDKITLDSRLGETVLVKQGLEETEKRSLRPSFLEYDAQTLTGKLLRWPDRTEMSFPVRDQLLVEYYSK